MTAASAALRVGGVQPFTSIDYPGALSAVVFVQGCPWRCLYCHNPQLQPRRLPQPAAAPDWPELLDWLDHRRGLLDAVVFSGGEPTADAALPQAVDQVRALGFRVGLHTAGMLPHRLRALLPRLDWVGLDIKAPLADGALHARISGVRGSGRNGASAVRESLAALCASGVAFECRTTAHPALLDGAALEAIAHELAAFGVERYALQVSRPAGAWAHAAAPGADYPPAATLHLLRSVLPHFELRRGTTG
ncbi:MAG: anaerobic ribonucleoside-triphosphate reductase activating protein [Rubrivivax sp.]